MAYKPSQTFGRVRRSTQTYAFYGDIGRQIKAARERQGLYQDWVACQLGIYQSTLSSYETGRMFLSDPQLFLSIAALLKLNIDDCVESACKAVERAAE